MTTGVLPGMEAGLDVRTRDAVDLLRRFEPREGYYLLDSGGKDSTVIRQLAREAGVSFQAVHNLTTIDPPELVRFIREEHPDTTILRPQRTFFGLMGDTKGFPTRRQRWCCEVFKERQSPAGVSQVSGVRAEESPRRARAWGPVTANWQTGGRTIAPIVAWTTEHVWEFIHDRQLPYCSLYDEGFHRLGCIGCPMGRRRQRVRQFERWPGYERAWKRGFQRVWDKRHGSTQRDGKVWFGDRHFASWEDLWLWWLSDEPLPGEEGCQGSLEVWN